ncbi:Flagellin and related hook-associated proteins [SAR116 cluster alpha proteobacterium HIMB100]|nr:Flagellin and related hook-associated proteins [SAR116 cluster alpha proteobacterium HIMB100]
MTVINTNVGALTARTYAVKATASTETAMERLSSGLRINSAADDAAGLAVANKMESQLRGMNMAIRNSQDGISLVQTAEAAMGEVNNMAIRMRELAVQMNNGVYTDSDRANAQLEVTALLAEIDKIANNAAFNEVKILDGTYSQDIRAGNTNPEIINVAIDRMNTDSLGGANLAGTSSVATNNQSADVNSKSRTTINLKDADTVTIKSSALSTGLTAFAAANSGGTYTLDSTSTADGFQIDSSGQITNNSGVSYSTTNSDLNTKSMTVTYTQGSNVYVEDVTLNIQAEGTNQQIKSAASTLTVNESANVSFRAVNTHQAVVATDGALSTNLQSFVSGDSYGGTWSLGGADASDLNIDANGVVTAALSFEADGNASTVDAGGSGTTGNQYTFDVIYTSSTGDKFTESVTLDVSNQNEEIDNLARDTTHIVLADLDYGSEYQVTVDGVTLTATKTSTTAGDTIAGIADALNSKNALEATPARGRFVADGANLDFVYDDAVGNHTGTEISDIRVRKAEVTGADETAMAVGTATAAVAAEDRVNQVSEVSGISGILNSAANGDQFRITVDSNVITTAAITGVSGSNNFSVADLAAALNTANAGAADVTFGTNNDKLTITTDSTKTTAAHTITANSFQWIDDSTSTTTSVGSIGTTTAANDAVAETIVIGGAAGETAAAATFTTNSHVGITINDVDYVADINGGTAGAAGIVAALNNNTAFSNLFTATVINTTDIQIEADNAGTDYAFTATNFRHLRDTVVGTGADQARGFMGGTSLDNAAATQQEGENTNAFDGAVNSSSTRTATSTGTATTQLNGNFGVQASSEVSEAKNTITVAEAAVVKFGTDAMSSSMNNYMTTTGQTGGTFSLAGADKESFEINANSGLVENKVNMDADGTKTSYTFDVVYTDKNGETFTDKVTLNLTNNTTDDVQHIADVNLSTQGGASSAIGILDSAINQISASQAKLGAIQNRLEHNIDNLSMASMLTETSKGRIIDADFAAETSELSKQQILAQAATSMLAQANQSKQGVLALLQ